MGAVGASGMGWTVNDLVEFLRARLDEDEVEVARWRKVADYVGTAYGTPDPPEDDLNPADRAYFALHKAAARVLAEVAAKRDMVAILDRLVRMRGLLLANGALATVDCPVNPRCACDWCILGRAAVLPYADHPDYNAAWTP